MSLVQRAGRIARAERQRILLRDQRRSAGVVRGCETGDYGGDIEEPWVNVEVIEMTIYQIIPNYVHGIVNIKENPVGVGHVQPLQEKHGKRLNQYQHILRGSLGSILRGFKAAATKEVHAQRAFLGQSLWQRNYYDHISATTFLISTSNNTSS